MDNWDYFYFSALRVIVAFVMAKAVADAVFDRRSNWIDYTLGFLGLCYLGAVFWDSIDGRWFSGLDQYVTRPAITAFLVVAYYGLHLERNRLRRLDSRGKEKRHDTRGNVTVGGSK
ncbi:hypothetical protein [Meiothermus granaticius]|uniref:Uncharacterized protein n=1 Tax=Meiothermus granaticius NBRC 107808 TaxID=1227551 RepID=A0A399F3A7_9DEIN|nr:hypothetical protein [Meiothermus granaticius]RIH90678.1 hypothetical protein Mgrana_03190 [Meiothermus granaticius NBRC 107808]GEM88460.1 hypothetical protein MGR01S_30850 [Meiothermus granaticius NBRC 107808]